MSRKRAYIPLTERLAAALACLLPWYIRDDYRHRKVPAEEVISCFHNDHIVLHAFDGSDLWWNLNPVLAGPHKEKSKLDTAIVAKAKRIDKKYPKWLKFKSAQPKPAKRKTKYRWPKRRFGRG